MNAQGPRKAISPAPRIRSEHSEATGHLLQEGMHIYHLAGHIGLGTITAMAQAIWLKLKVTGISFLTALGFTFPLTVTVAVLVFACFRLRKQGRILVPLCLVSFLVLLPSATWLGQQLAIGSVAPDAAVTQDQALQALGANPSTQQVMNFALGKTAQQLAKGPWTSAWIGKLLLAAISYGPGNFFFSIVAGALAGLFASLAWGAFRRLVGWDLA